MVCSSELYSANHQQPCNPAELVVYTFIFLQIIHSILIKWILSLGISILSLLYLWIFLRKGLYHPVTFDMELLDYAIFLIPAFTYFKEIFTFQQEGVLLKDREKFLLDLEQMENNFRNENLQSELEMQEQTFEYISMEIHDNISQILLVSKLNLTMIEQAAPEENEKIQYPAELLSRARGLYPAPHRFGRTCAYHIFNRVLKKTCLSADQ
jgi:hypothetical protein